VRTVERSSSTRESRRFRRSWIWDKEGSDRIGGVTSCLTESRGLDIGIDMLDVRERLRSSVAVMLIVRMVTVGRRIITDDRVKIRVSSNSASILYHLQVQIDLYAKDIHFDGILMMVMMVKS
jgi:hypothetical protein